MSDQEQARPPVLPITALGLLTIVAYGACYYAYGVLIQPISADTRWPDAALGAALGAISARSWLSVAPWGSWPGACWTTAAPNGTHLLG